MSDAHDAHGHGDVAVEEATISNKGIFALLALTATVFFASALTLPTVFPRLIDHIQAEHNAGNEELGKIRAAEAERLSSYGYVDKAKGTVHIPIDVAMQKVVEEAKK